MKMIKNLLIPLFLFLGIFVTSISVSAQQCGTPSPTLREYNYIKNHIANKTVRNFGTQTVPIMAHIVRQDDGSGGLTLTELNEGIARLNHYFYPVGIEFFICDTNHIDESDHYDFESTPSRNAQETALIQENNIENFVTDAVNLYFIKSIASTTGTGTTLGYAYIPTNISSKNRIVIDYDFTKNTLVLPHEFGHYFGLLHTHDTKKGVENIARTNCHDAGDLLCDTEADPGADNNYDNTCTYTGGGGYSPPINNIMSYYLECMQIFTAGQMNIMQYWYNEKKNNYTCLGSNIVIPTNLTTTVNGNSLILNWTDNANDELGYLIERSLSPTHGFQMLDTGGVAPNVTTFVDNTIDPNMVYYYRIKPSNGDPNLYSQVVSTVDVCDSKYKLPFPTGTDVECVSNTGNTYEFSAVGGGSLGGTDVVAARDGKVVMRTSSYVKIDHEDNEETSLYLYLKNITVNNGDCVKQGDAIGQVADANNLTFAVQSSIIGNNTALPICFYDVNNNGKPDPNEVCISGTNTISINSDVELYGGDWYNPMSAIKVSFSVDMFGLIETALTDLMIDGQAINTSNIISNSWIDNSNGSYNFNLDLSNETFLPQRNSKDISFKINDGTNIIRALGKIYFLPASHVIFPDVNENDGFTTNIEEGVSYGLFKGKGENFDPGGNLTRAEAAKVVCEAAIRLDIITEFNTATNINGTFSDISNCHWAYPYIQTLRNLGHIDAATNYHPDDNVTIGEMSKIIVNTLNINTLTTTAALDNHIAKSFIIQPNDGLKPFVEDISKVLFFNEGEDGTFFAEHVVVFDVVTTTPISRGEMALLLTNAYKAKYRELNNSLPPSSIVSEQCLGCMNKSNMIPSDFNNTTIIGAKTGLLPTSTGDVPAGMPTSFTMYDNQTLPLTYPSSVDAGGNSLLFYWTTNNGDLDTVSQYTDFRSVEFTPPTVSNTETMYIYFWTGNTKGKVQESVIEITVHPASMNTMPDWTVQNVSITPLQVEVGTAFTADYTVANIGGTSTGSGCDANMYLSTDTIFDGSDALIQSNSISALAANGTQVVNTTATVPLSTAIGTHYVIIISDDGNLLAEGNEFNNNSITQISVVPDCSGFSLAANYTISADPDDAHTVTFNNTSIGATTYWWNFGDGTTSTDVNPVHTFNNVQNYYVCLTATAADGCIETYCHSQSITAHLEVDNPNDTLVYEKGKTHTIQWRDNLAHTLRLDLYKANAHVGLLAASVPASDSTYDWTVSTGLTSDGDYRILITSNIDGSLVDYSDYFWIDDSLSTTIDVVSPSATDVWQMGECYHILWLDTIVAPVEIGLYKGAAYVGAITASTASDGHYKWCVPNDGSLTAGNDYRIRVYSGSYTDYSDYFTISENQTIQIIEPTCTRIARAGFSHSIDWIDNVPGNVSIRLYKGVAHIQAITLSTDSDGQFYWNVPTNLTQDDDYRILIQSIDDGNVSDYSDNFWIYTQTEFPIEVVYPNSTSRLQHNKTYKASYIANLSDNINLRLYKGAAYVDDIVLNTTSDGCYQFTVLPAWGTGTDYRILVETIDGASVDYSEYFEISEPLYINITEPNTSTIWKIGSQNTIEWLDNIPEKVVIRLYKGNAYINMVVDSTDSDGRHVWIVPGNLIAGTDYRFLMQSIRDGNILDYSDNFELAATIPIEVLTPDMGTTGLSNNDVTNITWNTTASITGNVTLELISENSNLGIIASNVPNTGSYTWNISNITPNGTEYRVKVIDENDAIVYDYSDYFPIFNPLPVELTAFDAKRQGEDVLLTWETASEKNNSHFEIERSLDGVNFEEIGQVTGHGTSQEIHNYEFIDENPATGRNYYRLKQVDTDNKFAYSMIRVVTIPQIDIFKINIYPNPTDGIFTIGMPQIGNYKITIFSQSGQFITTHSFIGNTKSIDLNHLPNGLYRISIENNGNKLVTKTIIIK